MRRTLLLTLAALAGLPAASAHAGYIRAESVDGPSADVVSVGDVDLSRDAGGAVVYLKREGGVPHVFASRLVNGAFAPGERVDDGLAAPASQPVVATADRGRQVVAFLSGGQLHAVVRRRGSRAWSAPLAIAAGASDPAIDMGIHGVTYITYTSAGDVRAVRFARDSEQFQAVREPVDINPARVAGTGNGRSRVAVAGDGSALVVWGEADRVHGRRIFETRLSTLPQEVSLADFEGGAGSTADLPEVDIEDDQSYGWVAFRQSFGGRQRALLRPLIGSQFETVSAIDAGATASGRPRLDYTGRGEGLISAGIAGNQTIGTLYWEEAVRRIQRFDAGTNGIDPAAVPAVGERERGMIAWRQGASGQPPVIRGRYVESLEKRRVLGRGALENPAFGPVDANGGLDASATRLGDVAVVFVQGDPGTRRVVAAFYDRRPTRPATYDTTTSFSRRRPLRWPAVFYELGAVTSEVHVDGRLVGRTRRRSLTSSLVRVKAGNHRYRVTAIDRRGQRRASRSRRLRVPEKKAN